MGCDLPRWGESLGAFLCWEISTRSQSPVSLFCGRREISIAGNVVLKCTNHFDFSKRLEETVMRGSILLLLNTSHELIQDAGGGVLSRRGQKLGMRNRPLAERTDKHKHLCCPLPSLLLSLPWLHRNHHSPLEASAFLPLNGSFSEKEQGLFP